MRSNNRMSWPACLLGVLCLVTANLVSADTTTVMTTTTTATPEPVTFAQSMTSTSATTSMNQVSETTTAASSPSPAPSSVGSSAVQTSAGSSTTQTPARPTAQTSARSSTAQTSAGPSTAQTSATPSAQTSTRPSTAQTSAIPSAQTSTRSSTTHTYHETTAFLNSSDTDPESDNSTETPPAETTIATTIHPPSTTRSALEQGRFEALNACRQDDCLNNSTCIAGRPYCTCSGLNTGKYCETKLELCVEEPCFVAEDCREVHNSLGFVCNKGFNTWTHFREHEYIFVTEKAGWMEAAEQCRKRFNALELASIPSPKVQEFIYRTIPNPKYYQTQYAGDDNFLPEFWIGLHRNNTKKWLWSFKKKRAQWTNWANGEPKSGSRTSGDTLATLSVFRDAQGRLPEKYMWYGRMAEANYKAWYICMRKYVPCRLSPCKNGAQCFSRNHDFYCQCPAEYTGRQCEVLLPAGFKSASTTLAATNEHLTNTLMLTFTLMLFA